MTTAQGIKQLFDRKLKECQTSGLSEELCQKKIKNGTNPTLKDRSIILAEKKCLLQKHDKTEYDQCIKDVLEEAIGEEAIEELQWIPMSTKFPNLKGVTDKDLEDFIFQQAINESPMMFHLNGMTNKAFLLNLIEKAKAKGLIPKGTDDVEAKEIARKYYLEQYFKRYKFYDRDEIYTDSQILFEKLKRLIREKENIPKFKYGSGHRDKLKTEIDFNTIFVTSPRGGHEFLSIFAYANKLDKSSFPGDIIGVGKDIKATTWIKDKTSKINRVIFIDDIVASGEQTIDALEQLKEVFGKEMPLYFISLCKRMSPIDWDGNIAEGELQEHSVTVHETMGMKQFNNALAKGVLDYGSNKDSPVSCAFVWSIPDGSSDRFVNKLYQEIGRTGLAGSRDIGTPRKTAEKERKTIVQSIPQRRFWYSLDNLPEEEKKRFAEYLFDQPVYTGYWVQEPILRSDKQTVWFRANVMEPHAKKNFGQRIQMWLDGEISAIDLNLITAKEWGGLNVGGEDFLEAFGYERNRRGLMEKKDHYFWNESKWREKRNWETNQYEDSPITEENQKLINIFAPYMASDLTSHEKYDYIDLGQQLQTRPDLVEKLLNQEVKIQDLLVYSGNQSQLNKDFPIKEALS